MDARGIVLCSLLHRYPCGSRRTKVYLKALETHIGRRAVRGYCCSDIALTPQMVDTVRAGLEAVWPYSQRLKVRGERFDEWSKARDGSVDVSGGQVGCVRPAFQPGNSDIG